jgi:hypothetical protein
MNPPAILTEFAMPDPGESPLNLQQLFTLANRLVASTISESYLSVVLQNGTPDVQDQDKVWFEKDSQGRPVNIKVFYHGKWRRVYNGMPGEIRGYSGAPGYHDNDPTSDFDSNGLGNVGGNYDGWGLCNGKNGRPDYSDKFLLGAHMNKADSHTDYNNGWQAYIKTEKNPTDKKTGGQFEVTLDDTNTFRPATNDLWVGRWKADNPARDDASLIYGFPKKILTGQHQGEPEPNDPPNHQIITGDKGRTPDTDPPIEAIPTLPPFIALGWIVFVGYSTA